ncbi:MAG: NifB/NifX family molybdenum-iron cluster-binding protein [Thermodesulfobacteriota bacterium]
MKICLATYQSRLAALFDNAPMLRLYTCNDDTNICPAGDISLPFGDPTLRVSTLSSCGANFLLCGAISGCTTRLLHENGIQVLGWLRGEINTVLQAWQNDTLDDLLMPGCRGMRCCRRRRGFAKGRSGPQ